MTDLKTGKTVPLHDVNPAAEPAHEHTHGHPHSHGSHRHTHGQSLHVHQHHHHGVHSHPHQDDEHGHPHEHSAASHEHTHHSHSPVMTLSLEQHVLAKNNLLAERNRGWFAGRTIHAVNLVSAPGAGKTALLERTIRELSVKMPISVIEGDQQTLNDARRIEATGCRVVQINTGTACHLDAAMIAQSLDALDPALNSIVFIENVGNLVCPALFDLGERSRVVIVSVTEGDDKPIKYPHMFRSSSLMLLNKIDLLPYVSFDRDRCFDYVRQVNPTIKIIETSATRGDGMQAWYDWLQGNATRTR